MSESAAAVVKATCKWVPKGGEGEGPPGPPPPVIIGTGTATAIAQGGGTYWNTAEGSNVLAIGSSAQVKAFKGQGEPADSTWSCSGKLSVQPQSGPSTQATGIDASGGSAISSPKKLDADKSYTYYAQGTNASAWVRDSEITAEYTVDGKTARDRVKVTVVAAELSPFEYVCVGGTQEVAVTLQPNPPGTNITLQLSCLGGSGSAVFAPGGGSTTNITNSTTVKITGVTASTTTVFLGSSRAMRR